MNVYQQAKFSMEEIAKAFGVKPYFEGGESYGVLKLDVPFNGRIVRFRYGDDEEDREIYTVAENPVK